MSDDTPRVDREGIHIDRDLADAISIEEELDSNLGGEYRFPSPARRRTAGRVYLAAAVVAGVSFSGGWYVAAGLALLALWQFASAWSLVVDEDTALTTAASTLDFPIGHASASVRFSGWRSRPRWSVVVYSATEPPDQRGLVIVDAVTGDVVETPYVEAITPV